MRVVRGLEAVEIGQHQRHRTRLGQGLFERAHEGEAVVEAGQRIGRGQPVHLVLQDQHRHRLAEFGQHHPRLHRRHQHQHRRHRPHTEVVIGGHLQDDRRDRGDHRGERGARHADQAGRRNQRRNADEHRRDHAVIAFRLGEGVDRPDARNQPQYRGDQRGVAQLVIGRGLIERADTRLAAPGQNAKAGPRYQRWRPGLLPPRQIAQHRHPHRHRVGDDD